jgi:hypothetical protein
MPVTRVGTADRIAANLAAHGHLPEDATIPITLAWIEKLRVLRDSTDPESVARALVVHTAVAELEAHMFRHAHQLSVASTEPLYSEGDVLALAKVRKGWGCLRPPCVFCFPPPFHWPWGTVFRPVSFFFQKSAGGQGILTPPSRRPASGGLEAVGRHGCGVPEP